MDETTEYEKLRAESHRLRMAATMLPLFTAEGINPKWWEHRMRAKALDEKAEAMKEGVSDVHEPTEAPTH